MSNLRIIEINDLCGCKYIIQELKSGSWSNIDENKFNSLEEAENYLLESFALETVVKEYQAVRVNKIEEKLKYLNVQLKEVVAEYNSITESYRDICDRKAWELVRKAYNKV